MRKLLIILLLTLFALNITNAQWRKVDIPNPYSGVFWLDVQFLPSNPDYGWACGQGSNVIRTTDGGLTWEGTKVYNMVIDTSFNGSGFVYDTSFVPGANQLESIHFVNENIGYVAGTDNGVKDEVYKSTDGGKSWSMTSSAEMTELWGVYFLTPDLGLSIGGGCAGAQRFNKTTDGGKTWSTYLDNISESGLTDCILYPNGTGYASSSGRIWETTNLGDSWSVLCVSGERDWQEEMTHSNNSFLVPYADGCSGGGKEGGGLRMSIDRGNTWSDFHLEDDMFGAFLLDSLRGWGCGQRNSVYYTSDGGQNWELRNCGIEGVVNLDDMWFVNDSLGWVVGTGVYTTHYYDTVRAKITLNEDPFICEGDSVLLSSDLEYEYYRWSTGDTTREIYAKAPGKYRLEVYNHICDFKIHDSTEVMIFPETTIEMNMLGNQSFCEGDSLIIWISNVHRGVSWSTGSNGDTIIVKESGRYEVAIIDTNGCEWIDFIDVSVNPKPVSEIQALNKVAFCDGDSTELTTRMAYSSYQWYGENIPDSILSQERTLKVFDSGNFYVIVENEFGCLDTSDYIYIEVWDVANRLHLMSYKDEEYLDFDSVSFTYMQCLPLKIINTTNSIIPIEDIYIVRNIDFSLPSRQLPATISPNSEIEVEVCFRPVELGISRDTLLLGDTCSTHAIPIFGWGGANIYSSDTDCGVGLEFDSKKLLSGHYYRAASVYPNPASSEINVVFEENASADAVVKMYDVLGNVYYDARHDLNLNGRRHKIMLSDISSGVYFLVISLGNETKTTKIDVIK